MSFSVPKMSAFSQSIAKNLGLSLCHLSVLSTPTLAEIPHVVAQIDESKKSDNFILHVNEAAERFAIPRNWIWAVMRTESARKTRAISPKGAMGLMQIMPQTWQMLRLQHRLGADPFNPRDNILAGAAYLREMHDRYGFNGFLAAYNAGPGRFDEHLKTGRPLPEETINYVTSILRRLDDTADVSPKMMPKIAVSDSDLHKQKNTTNSIFPQSHLALDRTDDAASDHIRVTDLSALAPSSNGLFVQISAR
ncbi:MAG: lytic transglycosylase domain-containing protein [Methylocystaceae bacterium]|nr:lytic transglycosylase domain-containing protein [Methylocystaceae bacterium]